MKWDGKQIFEQIYIHGVENGGKLKGRGGWGRVTRERDQTGKNRIEKKVRLEVNRVTNKI